MPASFQRIGVRNHTVIMKSPYFNSFEQIGGDLNPTAVKPATATTSEATVDYPTTVEARDNFRKSNGKRITAHQWAVYDFTLTIPRGNVTTYKDISLAVGGSPRSVGNALRRNPFSPYVPCHRVIASNLSVGGFFGEWGKNEKTRTRYGQKVSILSQEGVHFDRNGYLLASDRVVFKPEVMAMLVD